jgi:hypothetical protein
MYNNVELILNSESIQKSRFFINLLLEELMIFFKYLLSKLFNYLEKFTINELFLKLISLLLGILSMKH